MQFRKLLYFSNLINAQRQCQCHQRQHYRYDRRRYQHACKWNPFTFITVLIALMTLALAASPIDPIVSVLEKDLLQSHAYPQRAENLDNFVKSTNIKLFDNRNSTDDFERDLSAQLEREAELNGHANESNSDADYDTAAALQRKTLLSRKRRYLLFPEGTSFQLVYDGIFGVVDYTNYLILGITVALAWELPSKAPSEMLEDIKMQAEDGTLLLPRNDTAVNITYIDTKKTLEKLQQKQFSKPNYINLAFQKPSYDQRSRNNYYQTNKRPLIQPAFRPPMHRNYYHQSYSQSPYNYYRTKPGTSKKYAYYFQPKVKSYNAIAGMTPYSPYYYGRERLGDWRRKDNYYYKNVSRKPTNPFTKWLPAKSHAPTYGNNANSKYPWWNLASRLTNSLHNTTAQKVRPIMVAAGRQFNNINRNDMGMWQQESKQEQDQNQRQTFTSGYYQSNAPTTTSAPPTPRRHYIYPVFGKRSLPDTHPDSLHTYMQSPTAEPQEQPHFHRQLQEEHRNHHHHQHQQQQQHQHQHHRRRRYGIDNDELSKFDRIHIRHHRRTRHTLYDKIEMYLDKRGSHGHHCVLRALCETGQKANEVEPGSFLGEIMRALFTIPEAPEEDIHRLEYKEHRYDMAHAFKGNCATRYFHCKDSLWKSHFIA